MIINHRTAQLGVVTQKRPEVWQSYIPLWGQEDTGSKISISISAEQKLDTLVHRPEVYDEGSHVALLFGDHKLIDPTKVVNLDEAVGKVNLSVGDHKLIDPTKVVNLDETGGKVNLSVGDHALYIWGVRAEMTDLDNLKVSFGVGNHKLYEEQL